MTETPLNPYKIDLTVFEGPLDLLLHLIRKNELQITDIPIAFILDQYLEYLNWMEDLNIDLAGDFLLMASELAHIKSKILLPDAQDAETAEEIEDPRAELVRKLIEYQRYKEASQQLIERPQLNRDVFLHPPSEVLEEEGSLQVDLFQLVRCFYDLLKKIPQQKIYEVLAERVSVTEKIYDLVKRFRGQQCILFRELFDNPSRPEMIVNFLAILEMIRLKMIQASQTEAKGEIYLTAFVDALQDSDLSEAVTFQ